MLRLGLDANAIRALYVTTDDRPNHTYGKHDSSNVTYCCICAVHVTMQKLEGWWNLVIDFEHCGYSKKHQEAEINHGVHESCGTIAKQRAHVHTGAVVG